MELTVENLSQFIAAVNELHKDIVTHEFYHDVADMRTIYRGHSNIHWKLIPSLLRSDYRSQKEKLYLNEFIRQFPEECDQLSYFDILTKAQHYGLPTRLLDYTYNPLVALFFACNANYNEDGVVICRTKTGVFRQYDFAVTTILNFIFNFPQTSLINLDSTLIQKLIYALNKDRNIKLPPEESTVKKVLKTNIIIHVNPSFNNQRLKVQNGLFALYPLIIDSKTKENLEGDDYHRFIISRDNKIGILKELSLMGFNSATLFPELEYGLRNLVNNVDELNDRFFE